MHRNASSRSTDDGQRYTSDQTSDCEKLRKSLHRHVRAAKAWIVTELWSIKVVLTFARTYSTYFPAMLSHQVLRGSSTVHVARPTNKLGHLCSTRLAAAVKQTSRRQPARPALQQDVGKLASSASTECRQSRKARQGHRSRVVANATNSIQASYSSPESSKSSLTPVLIAVAIASLGALLFGLHVAIVNGLQDAVSAELGFSGNTGLRGAVCVHAVQVQRPLTCPQ